MILVTNHVVYRILTVSQINSLIHVNTMYKRQCMKSLLTDRYRRSLVMQIKLGHEWHIYISRQGTYGVEQACCVVGTKDFITTAWETSVEWRAEAETGRPINKSFKEILVGVCLINTRWNQSIESLNPERFTLQNLAIPVAPSGVLRDDF